MRVIYEKRAVILRCILRTLACLLLLALMLGTLHQARFLLPDGVYYTPDGVSFPTLEYARESCPALKISGWRETDTAVTLDPITKQTQAATLRYTDAWYFEFWDMELVAGSLFDAMNPANAVQSVLISEELAGRLFFTRDAVGREILVDGQVLIVTGVYAQPKAFLHRMSGTGRDILFVPCQSKLAADSVVTHLLVCASSGGAPPEEDMHTLDAILGNRLRYSACCELSSWKNRLTDLVRLYLFALAVIFTITQLRTVARDIRHFAAWYQTLDRTYTIPKRETVRRLWRPALCAAACVTALALTSFPLVIPAYFFPEDRHLLNVSHYIELLITSFTQRNAAPYDYAQTLYHYAIWSIHILGLTLAGAFTGLMGFWGNREST